MNIFKLILEKISYHLYIDRYFNILGVEIHIRVIPESFRNEICAIHDLIDAGNIAKRQKNNNILSRQYGDEASNRLKKMRRRWGVTRTSTDTALIRIDGMIERLNR